MKPQLSKQKGIFLLKRNEKLLPNSIYLIGSESSARNLFFLNKSNLEIMHSKLKQHTSIVMDILDYLFTPHGFVLYIKTKEEALIIKNYEAQQARKNKKPRYSDVSSIISEQIRFAISAGSRAINSSNDRNGTLCHSNFFRLIGKNDLNIRKALKFLKEKLSNLCRQNRNYRGKISRWNKNGLVSKNDILLSPDHNNENVIFSFIIEITKLNIDKIDEIIISTFKNHNDTS